MTGYLNKCCLLILVILISANANYNPFMDNVYFSIDWPGVIIQPASDSGLEQDGLPSGESLVLTTVNNEKYKCFLPPDDENQKKKDADQYTGPPELELLKTLFHQTTCSYRIESYWTYELCHGKYLRQYHEEKEMGKKPSLQEYFLGHYEKKDGKDPSASEPDIEMQIQAPPTVQDEPQEKKKVPLKKVEGIEIPFYEVNMTGGTPCDLTNGFRRAALHYVCQPEGKGEIYELKEVSTCEYEVIVLTNLLCKHPSYEMKKDPVNKITCHSLNDSPRRPRSLVSLEAENTQGRYNRKQLLDDIWDMMEKQLNDPFTDYEDDEDDMEDEEDEEDDEEEEGEPIHQLPRKESTKTYKQRVVVQREETPISPTTDQQVLREFLSGDYCIHGGTGWWRHEFCYGKHVSQFHEDKDGRTTIMLGKWNKEEHIQWLSKYPSKKPKPQQVIHYYTNGDHCDLAGKPRTVEVKLKCKENPSHPHSIAIYLVEPSTCQYHLVVESAILCSALGNVDENGLLQL